MVRCFDNQEVLRIRPEQVVRLASSLLHFNNIETDEVSFYFVDDVTISGLHDRFFRDPSPTDCISVPIDSPEERSEYHILGEIFICTTVTLAYARTHNLSPYEELSLYMVHGILHLIGYEDELPEQKKIMRQEEIGCMNYLCRNGLLLDNHGYTTHNTETGSC
ncbi:MAG: rRNA maturation RNase YbeY [Simkaniaceae bacterium]|nr:rRNA maturation RNase YbeY [Simkaniaceae bacterium]